jgi:hypothetical protein
VNIPDSAKEYKVQFGRSEENSMPWCECNDWHRFRSPCKHFCAIFQIVKDHGWDKLSSIYRDSPFFRIDEDVASKHVSNECADNNANGTNDNGRFVFEAGDDEQNEQQVTAGSQKNIASNCREALRTMNDLTYLCMDVVSLQQLHQQLNDVIASFHSILPKDGGLLLEAPIKRRRAPKKSVSFACIMCLGVGLSLVLQQKCFLCQIQVLSVFLTSISYVT